MGKKKIPVRFEPLRAPQAVLLKQATEPSVFTQRLREKALWQEVTRQRHAAAFGPHVRGQVRDPDRIRYWLRSSEQRLVLIPDGPVKSVCALAAQVHAKPDAAAAFIVYYDWELPEKARKRRRVVPARARDWQLRVDACRPFPVPEMPKKLAPPRFPRNKTVLMPFAKLSDMLNYFNYRRPHTRVLRPTKRRRKREGKTLSGETLLRTETPPVTVPGVVSPMFALPSLPPLPTGVAAVPSAPMKEPIANINFSSDTVFQSLDIGRLVENGHSSTREGSSGTDEEAYDPDKAENEQLYDADNDNALSSSLTLGNMLSRSRHVLPEQAQESNLVLGDQSLFGLHDDSDYFGQ